MRNNCTPDDKDHITAHMKPLFPHLALLLAMLPLRAVGQSYCHATESDGLLIITLPDHCTLEFTDRRPSSDALLCIPAAFTTPEGTIQGAYTIAGQMHGRYNGHTKVSIAGSTFSLGSTFTTANGFQQMCLVRNRQPIHFRDTSRYVRRALCKSSERGPAFIVQSLKPMTMTAFARLLSRRVHSAVYTDMGSYGFGWYHTSPTPTYLSTLYFYKQNRQTNWLVCRRNAE